MATSAGFDGDYTKLSDQELWEIGQHWWREASAQNIIGQPIARDTEEVLSKITACRAERRRRMNLW